jgi:hypothetical protein
MARPLLIEYPGAKIPLVGDDAIRPSSLLLRQHDGSDLQFNAAQGFLGGILLRVGGTIVAAGGLPSTGFQQQV